MLFLFLFGQSAQAQRLGRAQSVRVGNDYSLDWNIETIKFNDYETGLYLSFMGADLDLSQNELPRFVETQQLKFNVATVQVSLTNSQYLPLTTEEAALVTSNAELSASVMPAASVSKQKGMPHALISFVPLRLNPATGQLEKLMSFGLKVEPVTYEQPNYGAKAWAGTSVLDQGTFYRIAIVDDGVYALDSTFLMSIGLPVDSISLNDLNIYGNGFGMLPLQNSKWRPDDLLLNNILVDDGGDGVLNGTDKILFYGRGPDKWEYDSAAVSFQHVEHLFSDTSYYYIALGAGDVPARIPNVNSTPVPVTHNVTTYDDFQYHENDWVNLIKSGRTWFGEEFSTNLPQRSFNFSMPNIDQSSPASLRVSVISKTPGTSFSSAFDISVNAGAAASTLTIQGVGTSYTAAAGATASTVMGFTPTSANTGVSLNYQPYNASCSAWLNYIELQARRNLIFGTSDLMVFRDLNSVGPGNVANYTISSSANVQSVWEITDNNTANIVTVPLGNNLSFALEADALREFVAFSEYSYKTPIGAGMVVKQNLHGIGNVDMVIVTHQDFWTAASELAQFRRDFDGLDVALVTAQEVYNEFSGGLRDAAAIKDLMRMLYERANNVADDMPQYLLMIGDGSYDNKERLPGNTNFIPTYQNTDSWSVLRSFVSDDYFGLLDPSEGSADTDMVDIGIGRLPVQTASEAQDVVNKIMHYAKTGSTLDASGSHCTGENASPFGDWRNVILLIADDEDGNTHLNNTETHADSIAEHYPDMNIFKIYLDAYKQESTPGGERYPDATEAIKQRVEKGALIVNYTGHGGEVGWAHERILDVPTIASWENLNSLPLFMTATCEFSRFDDPGRTSAGEYVLTNRDGGGVGLLTTTRLVFSSPNFALNRAFYEYVYDDVTNQAATFGELCMKSKNAVAANNTNRRNFSLLGDPATRLAYPKYDVVTTEINGTPVGGQLDTLKALSHVSVAGFVADKNGQKMTGFSGVIYPTVYDKASNLSTLGQDAGSYVRSFELVKNVIYKGKVTVTNGDFSFDFVVPKDISYNIGTGRISYYAENAISDANGYSNDFLVGGSSDNVADDAVGPDIDLFLNDENFVSGGLTNETPALLAKVFDTNGINTVGNGIGHDITAVLDANTDKAIVLNDFYESDLDTYKSGSVSYPFSKLDQGNHTLTFKVWDVYNNSASTTIDFVVAEAADLALEHVLNYPNPFTTNTSFYFEHNQACEWLDVQVQVFTVSGHLVKSIDQVVYTQGFKIDPLSWDGRDDFGDALGRGVYVYRVKVNTPEGNTAEKFEKLVILK